MSPGDELFPVQITPEHKLIDKQEYEFIKEKLSSALSGAGITTNLTETGAALEQRLRNERQVELCLEGDRYYDVRRWKIADITENKPLMGVVITKNTNGTKTYNYTQVQTRVFNPQNYLLPIPRDEINRSALTQNPGYN